MGVLVTGGSGFLGGEIIRQLLSRGEYVKSFSRSRPRHLPHHHKLEICLGSITNCHDLKEALKGCNAVIHTAAKAGVWGPHSDYFTTNVTGTQNLLTICAEQHIPHFVYTSSPSVVYEDKSIHGKDESLPYARFYLAHYPHSKKEAELLVLRHHNQHKIQSVALRPHLIWGPGDPHFLPRLIHRYKRKRLFQVGDGTNLVDTIHVFNAAQAHLQVLDKMRAHKDWGGKSYFIGQHKPVLLWDFLRQLLERSGQRNVNFRSVPYTLARVAGATYESMYQALGFDHREPPMTRFLASQLYHSHYFSHQSATKDFGYFPSISTQQGLEELHMR
ncbi:MAG: NAD-dependent epimerase/dehydratase family protein [Zetaproteobacteria bacterium]|nr:NAD-dependent epimerase/dehydratase family protein [Zetaproteobacteria bacterium]